MLTREKFDLEMLNEDLGEQLDKFGISRPDELTSMLGKQRLAEKQQLIAKEKAKQERQEKMKKLMRGVDFLENSDV